MSLFDVKVARKRAQLARTQARQAVWAEVNKLLAFDKTKRLTALVYRLEAAAEHHGRLKERVGRSAS